MLGSSLNFQRTINFGSGSLKKIQKSENCCFQLFQKLLKLDSFHENFGKEPAKKFLASSLTFSPKKFESGNYIPKLFFLIFEN
jgi:hypothetical protein